VGSVCRSKSPTGCVVLSCSVKPLSLESERGAFAAGGKMVICYLCAWGKWGYWSGADCVQPEPACPEDRKLRHLPAAFPVIDYGLDAVLPARLHAAHRPARARRIPTAFLAADRRHRAPDAPPDPRLPIRQSARFSIAPPSRTDPDIPNRLLRFENSRL